MIFNVKGMGTMDIEIISKDTEKIYDNHGCSWGWQKKYLT